MNPQDPRVLHKKDPQSLVSSLLEMEREVRSLPGIG